MISTWGAAGALYPIAQWGFFQAPPTFSVSSIPNLRAQGLVGLLDAVICPSGRQILDILPGGGARLLGKSIASARLAASPQDEIEVSDILHAQTEHLCTYVCSLECFQYCGRGSPDGRKQNLPPAANFVAL